MTTEMPTKRKPRIALMGEFSAGKSTLSNLLLGARPLPEKVTATRLSPVWMASGDEPPYRIDIDGTEDLVSIEHLEEIPVEDTRVIRLFFESDILDVCDLIDFPGISDPNMSTDVVERMLEEVRVLHETKGEFAGTYPISLLQALQAGEDVEKWDASGAGAFSDHLIEVVQELTLAVSDKAETLYTIGKRGETVAQPAQNNALLLTDPVVSGRDPEAGPVVPRRVRAKKPGAESPQPDGNYGENTPGSQDNLANTTQIAS